VPHREPLRDDGIERKPKTSTPLVRGSTRPTLAPFPAAAPQAGRRRSGADAFARVRRRDGVASVGSRLVTASLGRVVAAESVSSFGSMLSRLAIPWVAALVLDATPFEMGLLLVADVAAGAVGTLLLGAWVDRAGKRAVLLGADVVRAVLIGLLAWLAVAGQLSLAVLVGVKAAAGLATVVFELARSAWIARHVEASELPAANARVSAASSLSETAAFALGGWLYQGLGATLALAVDAATYLISASFVTGVHDPAVPAPARAAGRPLLRSLLEEARDGVSALRAVPALRAVAAIGVLIALGTSLAGTSYMIFVARDLGFATGPLGVIFATGGIGSLAGAGLAPRLGRRFGAGGAMRIGTLLLTLGAIALVLAPAPTLLGALLLVVHQVVADGGQTLHDVHDRTLRQTAVPAALRARVDAGIRTLEQAAMLVGAVGGGVLATSVGARAALLFSAGLFGAAAVVAWRRLGSTPLAPTSAA
jgi:Na+/melibiose symporter-like transporter